MLISDYGQDCKRHPSLARKQAHVHELTGSVQIDGETDVLHGHRFAIVSDKAEFIPSASGHVHKVIFRTDFYEDHYHEFTGYTGSPIDLCDGRHIHYISNVTDISHKHRHKFCAATLIDDPVASSMHP